MAVDERRYWGVISPNMPVQFLAAIARQHEETGMEGVFAPQVYGPPFVPLAAAAAVTTRLKLASGIALAFARSPFETAMAAMDLDRLSGGRFILGLGASVRSWSGGFFGMPYDHPLDRLREVVGMIRQIIAKSHTGQLRRLSGTYYDLDFSEFQPLAEPLRTDLPIWLAALRRPLVEMAGEIADGVMGHPIWSIPWLTRRIPPALEAGLRRGGRRRSDVHVNIWLWVAPNEDRRQAVQDARATVAFYAGVGQYESYFAAHGFRQEALRLQEGVRRGDYLSVASQVPDEMAETFVVCGTPGEVRAKVEKVWEVADSVCLVPPAYGLSTEQMMAYTGAIARTFYM